MATKTEKIVAALLARGLKEVQARSKKYRQFTHPVKGKFYFVGKSGALRAGANIGDSVSLTSFIKV